MSNSPWLSVIIPTYNGVRHLNAAIDSIVAQGDGDLEVIAVDDGSTDSTVDVLKSFIGPLDLKIVEGEHRGNWVRNTNVGMSLARGDFVCWLHQDDAWLPGRLAALCELIRDFPAADFIFHPSQYIDDAGRRVGVLRCPLPGVRGAVSAIELTGRLLIQNFISAPAPLIRTSTSSRIGLPDENLWYVADWDYWLRLAQVCNTVFCPEILTSYRVHAQSKTTLDSERIDERALQFTEVLARHLPAWKSLNPDRRDCLTIPIVARFSADVNLALMRCAQGNPSALFRLVSRAFQLGPRGLHAFIANSRIIERCWSRLRM